jgi:hypothetical protein
VRFERFFSLGFQAEDKEQKDMLSLWSEIADHNRSPTPTPLVKYHFPRKALNDRALILLHWTVDFRRADLDALLRTGASVVACLADGETLYPGNVIENVPCRLLLCCSWEAFAKKLSDNRDSILGGQRAYPSFTLVGPRGNAVSNPQSFFLANPFEDDRFASGAKEALGTRLRYLLNEPGNIGIGDKVRDAINECAVVIANVGQDPGENDRGYNPNVWYEIGYAWKAEKPVVFFRHINNKSKWPSDIGEREFQTWSDPVDLALQLFYGLGGQCNP